MADQGKDTKSLFDHDDAKELARLLEGVNAAERDRKALEKHAVKAQKAVDDAAREVSRWQKAYDDFARNLAWKAMKA